MLSFIPVPVKISRRRYVLYFMDFENNSPYYTTSYTLSKRSARLLIDKVKKTDSFDDAHVKALLLNFFSESDYNSLRENLMSFSQYEQVNDSNSSILERCKLIY